MCGINKDQFRYSVAQVDDALSMAQEWLEQLHQQADRGGLADASVELAQVSVMLGDARAKLENVTGSKTTGTDSVTIEAV